MNQYTPIPNFQPFVMERMMSKFEQEVDYNLSESGVHPILLRELLAGDPDLVQELLATDLNYPYVNGMPELRQNIERLRREKSVLVVPGDHFGLDHFLHISFGLPHDYLAAALDRMLDLIETLKS